MANRRGRPSAPTNIVNTIIPTAELPNLRFRYRSLALVTGDDLECIRWLAEHGLIAKTHLCPNCDILMSFQKREGERYVDGYAWSCKNCRIQRNLRDKSFFEGSHLKLTQLLDIIYLWSVDVRQHIVCSETEVSRPTLVDWQNYIRDICAQYLLDHPTQLGGPNKTVEIDESYFMRRKYNRGEVRDGQWVLGLIERESKNCVLVPVPDRAAATLLPIIQQHVAPGTRIITDQWAAYNQLPNHFTVNHRLHFVSPTDPTVHTNTIEGCWAHAKAKYRSMHGTSENLFDSYLQEFMWKRLFQENIFGNILFWISFYYPV